MSDREFDNYLTLLAGLLRLDGKQRGAIAEELRSHLEDRLEELVARGVSRDEAIQQALAEFGDAAGLAGQFVAISRNRKRRWIMRAMTFSVAAILLFAAGLAILWPGRNAAPGVAATIAQEAVSAAASQQMSKTADEGEAKLAAALNRRMDIKYVEAPLHQVFADLTKQTGVTFYLMAKKLDEAAVPLDTPITSVFNQIRLSTWLELALAQLELTYVEKDDLIIITTPEDAEATLQIRVYDCRDLLRMEAPPGADKFVSPPAPPVARSGGMFSVEDEVRLSQIGSDGAKQSAAIPGAPAPQPKLQASGGMSGMGSGQVDTSQLVSEHDLRANRLMQIIQTNVDEASWGLVGGPGSISEYNGLIVVTQTAQTHKKVEHVLDMLRQAAGLEVPKAGKVVR